jgi:16S rRNA (guanine966-N2)-methyltransferase
LSRRLRVIGGEWRSRVVQFPEVDAIRPTPDRVRETLFNWLRADIHDAQCLEPFAGSGILSIEALSRGANHCICLDQSANAIKTLNDNFHELKAKPESFQCVQADARAWIKNYTGTPFDLIFLDPPFKDGDAQQLISLCTKLLKPAGFLYFETPEPLHEASLNEEVSILRQKRAGSVHYALLQRL